MRSRRGGFSLLMVLWLTALLSALGLHWSVKVRRQVMALGHHVDRVETMAAAEAGLAVVRGMLDRRIVASSGPGDSDLDPWRVTGTVDLAGEVAQGSDLRWRATVYDLGSRINLNNAEAVQLRRLLSWLGTDSRRAARIADATLDWRDADEFERPEGAERDAYLSAEAARLPPNRAFEDVGEWALVLGVSQEVYERAAPYLTVDGSGRVNLATAPDPVVISLPGFGPEALGVLRSGYLVFDIASLAGLLSPAARAAIEPHRAWLESRTTFITDELQIEVMGYRPGRGYETRLSAVMARSGSTSSVVTVRERAP